MHSTRRQVLRSAGIFGALFLSRGLIACAANTSEAFGSSGEALATCGDAVIGRNHGHKLEVSAEDVAAGVDKTFSIQGAASHDHDVTVTAAQFAQLAVGGSITFTSTTTLGHQHPVTVTCAASTPTVDAGSTDGSAPEVCVNGATAAAISQNHGHTLVVPTADVNAAVTKTYSIQGTASHDHTITITPAQFAQLATGATITDTSTTTFGHQHVVKVICA